MSRKDAMNHRHKKFFACVICVALMGAACNSSSPTAPSGLTGPNPAANTTADVIDSATDPGALSTVSTRAVFGSTDVPTVTTALVRGDTNVPLGTKAQCGFSPDNPYVC